MKIAKLDAIPLSIPFEHGGPPAGWGGPDGDRLDTVLVRIETEDGLVGYGDAFAYNCRRAVVAAVEDMIAPRVIGRDATDVNGLAHEMQQKMHLFGRYGITMFALSGLDIALWDLAGKAAGLPLSRLFGGAAKTQVPCYASLFPYHDQDLVTEYTKHALEAGFEYIKLHEIDEPEVRAAREAAGEGVPLMVDANCPWSPAQAREMAFRLSGYDLAWLEEPIFPPENFAALAKLQHQSGIPLAAGENACTVYEFHKMFAAGAVTFAQPSVTKVGGISEFRKIAVLAEAENITLMPHSPYFGPGFLATLHLTAALPADSLVEWLYVNPQANLYGTNIDPANGMLALPEGPGLGLDPDPDVIAEFRVKED